MAEKKQLSHRTNLFLMCARKVLIEEGYFVNDEEKEGDNENEQGTESATV